MTATVSFHTRSPSGAIRLSVIATSCTGVDEKHRAWANVDCKSILVGAVQRTFAPRPGGIGQKLHTSTSTRDHLVAAAASNWPLGVDIERAIPDRIMPWALLSPSERDTIMRYPANKRPGIGAMIWAAKEAWWKACALPIERDPASYSVTITSDGFVEVDDGRAAPPHSGRVFWHEPLDAAIGWIELTHRQPSELCRIDW
jgi:hypothetical protein